MSDFDDILAAAKIAAERFALIGVYDGDDGTWHVTIHDADLLEVSYCYGATQVEINVALSELAASGSGVRENVWAACDDARKCARDTSPW